MNDSPFTMAGLAAFRDAVVVGSGKSLNAEELRHLFERFSPRLQNEISRLGFEDPAIQDVIAMWIRFNPHILK